MDQVALSFSYTFLVACTYRRSKGTIHLLPHVIGESKRSFGSNVPIIPPNELHYSARSQVSNTVFSVMKIMKGSIGPHVISSCSPTHAELPVFVIDPVGRGLILIHLSLPSAVLHGSAAGHGRRGVRRPLPRRR